MNGFIDKSKLINKVIFIVPLMILIYHVCAIGMQIIYIDAMNSFIFTISLLLAAIGFIDIIKKGVMISNVFCFSWFLFLAINNFNISGLQRAKDFIDLYYLFTGPLIFYLIVKCFDDRNISLTVVSRFQFNPNFIAKILIVISVLLKIIIFFSVGTRLTAGDWGGGFGTGSSYNLSGFTGFYYICIWSVLLLLPKINSKYRIIAILIFVFFDGILAISRQSMVILFLYLLCIYCYSKKDIVYTKFKSIIYVMLGMGVIFALVGNYRQMMRGWEQTEAQIATLMISSTENSIINWLYSYTSLNFDIMLYMFKDMINYPMTMYSSFAPYVRLLGGAPSLTNYYDAVYHSLGNNGYNMSSMFGPMIYENGVLYIIQALVLAIHVGFLGMIARKQKAYGVYALLIAFGMMAVTGNMYTSPIYFYIIVTSIGLSVFIDHKQEEYK